MKITRIYKSLNDLHAVIPRRLSRSGYAFPPMRVGCVLTHRCNLRCAMCFVWQRGQGEMAARELSTDEWKKVIDQIPRFAIVTFTGGEPLVRKDLTELLTYACRSHRVHLVSNGTMFDEELADLCVRLAPGNLFGKGLVSVGVSLEGPADVHDSMVKVPGSYARTTGTLSRLVEFKKKHNRKFPLLDLKIVICKETQGSLLDLYNLSDNLGLDIISYQQCSTQESSYGIDDAPDNAIGTPPPPVEVIPREELIPEMETLLQRAKTGKTTLRFNPDMELELFGDRYENRFPLEKFTCSAAWSVMHIGPYGTVFPCFSIPMGNLRDEKLMKIWNGPDYRKFRQQLRKAEIFPGCTGCCVMKKKG